MASVQCHKPSEQTNPPVQYSTVYEKTTVTEVTCQHNKHHTTNNDHHSFTDKVKEMANSARKMFSHEEHHGSHGPNNGHHVGDHTKKPAYDCYGATAHDGQKMKKKNKVKKTEGHCMPKMHKKVHKDEKHGGCISSDSGSSSESENETCKKKH